MLIRATAAWLGLLVLASMNGALSDLVMAVAAPVWMGRTLKSRLDHGTTPM